VNITEYLEPSSVLPQGGCLSRDVSLLGRIAMFHNLPSSTAMEKGSLAIVGVMEDRNSCSSSSAQAPDAIRAYLYGLSGSILRKPLLDLGNLKPAATPAQTYSALEFIAAELMQKGITLLVLGGTHELTWPLYKSVQSQTPRVNLSIVDSTLDMGNGDGDFSSKCYLDQLSAEPSENLLTLSLLGYQGYLTNHKHHKALQDNHHETVRLGFLRSSMSEVEPTLRDAHFVSFDMSSIRQSDSPGVSCPSPNGLYAEEACQLARYAGNSPVIKCFGIFDLTPLNDPNGQSQHLAAQIAWHFIEAYNQRAESSPTQGGIKRFYVKSPIPNVELVFLHNNLQNCWWMELPGKKTTDAPPILISCSYSDYQKASMGEVPDRWLNAWKRLM
jgi:formiminoglutamase